MNCSLDYRTDFYSLGVTFYEFLTGQLPFDTQDPLELVHCHIAKQPISPHEIQPSIPIFLSKIVMKLMEKIAENRYQSTLGIQADLEYCLEPLPEHKSLNNFPLATQDITDKFQVSQRLYGREIEVNQLLAAFARVTSSEQQKTENNKIEVMLITGYSGMGKSSLVQEIYKPITEKKGYFISGKFDQLQRNIPYFAVVNAFKELVKQLLSESAEQLNQWREKLLTVLGINGQVIIDVIPEVELIIGKQSPVANIGLQESKNRFNFVFKNFIQALCTKEHPLVIFLDDLQWADGASLQLIERILTDGNIQYLFIMVAYRDNEIHPTHPLMQMINQLHQANLKINYIQLKPLTLEAVSQLITDTLYSDILSVKPLAELVIQKTAGNPFFINEFLKMLHSENLLTFTPSPSSPTEGRSLRGSWQWNIEKIEDKNITDNVIDLMTNKFKKLPESTQQILQFAACVGAFFDLNTLAIISQKSPAKVYQELTIALQSGFILTTSALDSQLLIQDYKFLHDRVQQAAYALIDPTQKQEIHLQMGCLLLENIQPERLSEEIFEIVDHLNLGLLNRQNITSILSEKLDKNEISKLNFMAGQKAKSANAYQAAAEYFNRGLNFLPQSSWQTTYPLTLALHQVAIEVAYLNGHFNEMETLGNIVLNQAKNALDTVKVYDAKIQALVSQGNLKAAIKIGLEALKILGISLPEQPSNSDIHNSLKQTALLLNEYEIKDLINLPPMGDSQALAAMYILSSITASAYISDPKLFLLVTTSQVNLSIQYGNTTESAMGYACYGALLCGVIEDIESGYQFGVLASNLVEKLNAQKIKAKVDDALAGHIINWKDHCQKMRPIALEGYYSGLENGELEFSSYCGFWVCVSPYFVGYELRDLEQEMATYSQAISQTRQEAAVNWIAIFWQATQNLLGKSENLMQLTGNIYNEEQCLPLAIAASDRVQINFFYLNKLILCYLFKHYDQAQENAILAEQNLDGVMGMIVVPIFYFYDSLVHLKLSTQTTNSDPEIWINRVTRNQNKMQKWATHAPENFLNKFYLVEAEKARVLGKILEAEDYYEQAISQASKNKFIQEEALAYELAAEFYLGRGRLKIARTYMKESHYLYKRWGAKTKVEDLETKYPQLISSLSSIKSVNYTVNLNPQSTTGTQSGEVLDLAAVIKASQAISGEILIDKLLIILMKVLIENAGAQLGYLIVKTGNEFLIEAEGSADFNGVKVLQSIPVDGSHLVANSIINYVVNTGETVVLKNASCEGKFINDPYIKVKQSKSILCLPLISQGRLTSIMYLENDRATGAFTQDRLEILKLLSAQAAIAIENAKLYANLAESNRTLETKVEERTAELAIAKQKAEATADAKSAFLANMSHELRSPLTAILGFTQVLLKSSDLTSEHQEKIRIIHRSAEHLLALISDVLDMAKIESGCTTLNPINFNLPNFLNGLKEMFDLKAQEKKLDFVLEYSSELPQRVFYDEVKLRQVLINLLSNAFKFTSFGRISLRSKLKKINHQDALEFEVEDQGCGIFADELEKIFQPFIQTKSGQQVQGGTGLGLAISNHFIQLMGGKINVESEVGTGTIFKCDIPYQAVTDTHSETPKNKNQVIPLELDAQNHKILIIDNHPDTRLLLIELLQPLNLDIKEANNEIEGIQMWETWQPDLILIDVQMPTKKVDKITQTIREKDLEKAKSEPFKPVKIIAISASPFAPDFDQNQAMGYDDLIGKPFTETDIFEAIHGQIGVRMGYSGGEFSLEETSDSLNPNPEISSVSILTRLVALTPDLIDRLEQAVIRLNTISIESISKEINTNDPVLSEAIQRFVDDFDHSTLWDLIQAAKAQQ
ncbi:MAG: AAA family ATPase [Planktothrix sp. GU0601_MAG3]|nr:MAG: AAA family ATPase [Planktothrix sp. GU0601_MAG3]